MTATKVAAPKKKDAAKKKAPKEACAFCGKPISPDFGTATCANCGERKCVEFCIPGGDQTICVDCDEGPGDEAEEEAAD